MSNQNLNTLNVKTLNYTGEYIYHRGVPVVFGSGSGGIGPTGMTGATGNTGPIGPTGMTGGSIWSENPANIYYDAGTVGIGTNNPTALLDVSGSTRLRSYLFDISDNSGNPGDVLTVSYNYPGLQWAPLTPIGTIAMWYLGQKPTNWLLCNGDVVPLQYTDLSNVIGSSLPDFRGRFPAMAGNPGASGNYIGPLATSTDTSCIPISQIPAHTHVFNYNAYNSTSGGILAPDFLNTDTSWTSTTAINSTGGGEAYAPPYLSINFIIYAGPPDP
jgi:microcystin-dependent protein